MRTTTIECPHCHKEISVDEVLAHSAEERIRKELSAKFSRQQSELDKQLAQFQEKEALLKKQQQEQDAQAEEKVATLLRTAKMQLEFKLKKQLADENADQLELLRKELNEKSVKLKELNKATAEIERLKRDNEEKESQLIAKFEKDLSLKLAQERTKIKEQANSESEMRIKELQAQLDQQIKLTAEMKKKQEQGSMQLQGEAQELALEEYLQDTFPLDTIKEIGKGKMGGDCIQVVNTRAKQNCGKIYYESKRTKSFSNAWIEKFKQDMRNEGVEIGVIVSEAMPADMPRMGLRDGVYICTFEEFKGLSIVLRQTIIRLSEAVATQENKGDKMEMLYSFLTSNEFRMQVDAIVQGFRQMKDDLELEKATMRRLWKKREKQLEKVTINTLDMHGAIQGIAGKAVQDIQSLEINDELYLEN